MSSYIIDKHKAADLTHSEVEGNEMGEDFGREFEAAWEVFSRTARGAVAPEATSQTWFAH